MQKDTCLIIYLHDHPSDAQSVFAGKTPQLTSSRKPPCHLPSRTPPLRHPQDHAHPQASLRAFLLLSWCGSASLQNSVLKSKMHGMRESVLMKRKPCKDKLRTPKQVQAGGGGASVLLDVQQY